MRVVVVDRDHVAVHALLKNDGLAAGTNVLFDQCMFGIQGHVTDSLGLGIIPHEQAQWIIGVENSRVLRDLDGNTLELC